ncbi:hypothetical protein DICVIV_13141 [Dictyocaulus viviparus]|uniref:Uncharacterized protein n=1 Tax=Dictyocaulus viviparus TaxID=29172 RepID=A0A0D8XB65_DICVI|nr:hypothetical protein DICVIV_13141 [Dictyocaulus viviparus]
MVNRTDTLPQGSELESRFHRNKELDLKYRCTTSFNQLRPINDRDSSIFEINPSTRASRLLINR